MNAWIWITVAILVLAVGASLQAVLMAARGKSRGAMSTPAAQRRLRRRQRRGEPSDREGPES